MLLLVKMKITMLLLLLMMMMMMMTMMMKTTLQTSGDADTKYKNWKLMSIVHVINFIDQPQHLSIT